MSSPEDRRVKDDTAEFRAHTGDDLSEVKYRMQYMESQHLELRKAVENNTALTINNANQISNVSDLLNKLVSNLSGLIKISGQVEGAFELGKWVGKLAIWVGIMATFSVTIWAVFKFAIIEALRK